MRLFQAAFTPAEDPRATPAPPESLAGREEAPCYAREVRLTLAFIAFTLVAWAAVTWETGGLLLTRLAAGDVAGSVEQFVFIAIIQALIYGNFVYQLTRLGYLKRRLAHQALLPAEREGLYEREAPALAILVPAYKEELAVVRRTLMSAALQDYPARRVVLLIDDPPQPSDGSERAALNAMRALPDEIRRLLAGAAAPLAKARADYGARVRHGAVSPAREAGMIAIHYDEAARWLETYAEGYPIVDHGDRLFIDRIVMQAARGHRGRARCLRLLTASRRISLARIEREYARLASLFEVELTSFERKRYVTLSHEPNKAMNLNSYIGLLGSSWREVRRADGVHLEPAKRGPGTFDVSAAEFLITLDADSLLVPDYALILVNEMLRPGNERLAVAQTPYNTIPDAPGLLERVAGATTDIQYLIHQGFTRFAATYWVGANALLRVAALHDIKENVRERGHEVSVFIQNRTVIEDTESSVDLVARGWKLYNYPERLAFSATPPDFGSLLIQRRRWANGGLIILPKLLRYLASPGDRARKAREGFFRVHYLGSIAAVNLGLVILLGHSFEHSIESAWLPLTALPYFYLYARDLRYNGYRMSDAVRVYALNLLLIPVNLGGVVKSLQQALTGRRIPFGRTPKVSGRTAAPALYIVAEYALLASWLIGSAVDASAGLWYGAFFGIIHAALLAYAIGAFIGARESWADVRDALPERLLPSLPTAGAPAPGMRAERGAAGPAWHSAAGAPPLRGDAAEPARNEGAARSSPGFRPTLRSGRTGFARTTAAGSPGPARIDRRSPIRTPESGQIRSGRPERRESA